MQPEDHIASDGRMDGEASRRLRSIPSVDKVMAHAALEGARARLPHDLVVAAVRDELAAVREALKRGSPGTLDAEDVAEAASKRAWASIAPSLHPVINATGVVIHTNLGRAPLSHKAVQAIRDAAAYNNLEYDLEAGERGSRYSHAVSILRRVTGCEDALVVNNNAAALVLVLSALSLGKEAIVSRGQLVEIGGGFRIPEIMQQSGAKLVEVGTTNRTYVEDYRRAITAETALLMRIHASNFRIVGFTTSPSIGELVALGQEHQLVMVDDVGSGALLDTTRFGLAPEPMVQASLQAGADLALFSGDKLLGGPQCGVIVGRGAIIARMKKHPLARALRVDKLTLAGLEATLLHYLKGEAEQHVPIWRMISMSEGELKEKARQWAGRLSEAGVTCQLERGASAIGGGSLPGETLPTWLVSITPPSRGGASSEQEAGRVAAMLRRADRPVVARVERGALLLDPRTVLEGEEETLLAVVAQCIKDTSP